MKTFIYTLLTFALMCKGTAIHAQQNIPNLKIGDQIPDIILHHVSGQKESIPLKKLDQQDLLVINFWATWCPPCVKELNTFNDLAGQFNGKMKVLAVAYEKGAVVDHFFQNHPEIKTNNLTVITDDTLLIDYFRHRILPHNIWIDHNGVIKNITGVEAIQAGNIDMFIHSKPLSTETKSDVLNFDAFAPFHLRDTDFTYRSIYTSYTQGINGGYSHFEIWGHSDHPWYYRVFMFNESREQMLWMMLFGKLSSRDYYNILKIDTKDSTRFYWPKQCPESYKKKYNDESKWRAENLHCYDLTLPKAVPDSIIYKDMLEDFKRVNNIEVKKIYPKMRTCVLKIKDKGQFKVARNDSAYIDINPKRIKVHNFTPLYVFRYLNEMAKPDKNAIPLDPPYIDETGINYPIDLEVDLKKENPTYQDVKNWLSEKYGFTYEYKTRPFPTYLVKDLAQ